MRKKKLTAAQKKVLSAHNIDPAGWLFIREDEQLLTVQNNSTGEVLSVGKEYPKTRKGRAK